MSDNFYRRLSYWCGLLPLGAVFGLVFYMAQVEIKDLDLWLHIGVGKFITLNHFVPREDILSCSIAGAPWVNHEWLFQVIVYNIFHFWGPDGLIKMQAVIVILTMLLLLFLGYSKDKQLILAFILFLVSMVYNQRFTIRPDIYSLFFFAFYIFVLALHIDKKWTVPALFVVQVFWTNIHGFFFFGPLFVLIGLVSEWVKRHVKLPYEWNESGRLTDDEYRRLKLILAAVAAACLLNPCGLKGALYPIGVFFSLSQENKIFFDHIQELQRPIKWGTWWSSEGFMYYKLLILLSGVSFILNRRRIDISALLFWFVFLVFSLKAARNTAFFAIAAYLVIMTNFFNISYRDVIPMRFTRKKFLYMTSTVVKMLFLIWIFQFGGGFATNGYYDFDKYERKSEFGGISRRSYPDKAVDFLVESGIRGNFFNDFNSGAYLIGRTFPDLKVFIDGRTEVYGGKFFEEYLKIWEQGDGELFDEMVRKYNLTGALLNSTKQHIPAGILKHLYHHKDWKPVYFNYDGVIFLRDVPENRELIKRHMVDLSQWQPILLDLAKVGSTPIGPYQHYYRAITLESLGLDEPAMAEAQEAVRVAPGYADIYGVMGKIYAKRKEYQKAFEHLRLAVVGAPHDKTLRHSFALCYLDLGEYKGAVQQYQKIIGSWPDDPRAYFLLSKAYAKDKQYDQTLDTLRKVHQLSPQDAADIYGIGDIVYEQGDYEKALEIYTLAMKPQKDLAVIHKKLGLTYEAMGKRKMAAEEFEQSLLINAEDTELRQKLRSPLQ